ncbi:transmembrane protein, putative [Medicago truncatula]|uniref:Transmembrane protein, putative n=1 Tax=Medicago truncatula TaxID=3880 RepID=G7L4B7_MEDTR|nr:transmembrane protein, putative [Medicago truncatula]
MFRSWVIFSAMFYMVLSALTCIEMVRQVFGSNLGIGKLKLGFWGEKWVFPELLSDSTSCFMFLRIFHMFLF